jgi:hypothetical protein
MKSTFSFPLILLIIFLFLFQLGYFFLLISLIHSPVLLAILENPSCRSIPQTPPTLLSEYYAIPLCVDLSSSSGNPHSLLNQTHHHVVGSR